MGTQRHRGLSLRSRPCRAFAGAETLEDRVVPSLTTSTALANTSKLGAQTQAVTATSGNGSSVVVWTEAKGTKDSDIKAQPFDANGRKVSGEIVVATSRSPQHHSAVAMDAGGNFTVVWTHDYSTEDSDIHGADVSVPTVRATAVSSPSPRRCGASPMPASAWPPTATSWSPTRCNCQDDSDVKAVQYRASGGVVRKIDVAATSRLEERGRVAVNTEGQFSVSYQSQGNVFVSRISTTGVRTRASAAWSSPVERNASLGMDRWGNVTVAWQEYGRDSNIYAHLIGNGGTLGRVFTVMATASVETNPAVAVDAGSGKSMMAYHGTYGTTTRILVTEFTERQAYVRTSTMGLSLANAAASVGGSWRRFVVAAQATRGNGDDVDGGIFAVFGTL